MLVGFGDDLGILLAFFNQGANIFYFAKNGVKVRRYGFNQCITRRKGALDTKMLGKARKFIFI